MILQGATVGAWLEKAGQGWRRVKPYLLGFLVVLAVAGAIWALYYVPKMQVPVCPPGQDGLPPKICFDIENEARKTLAYTLGGILAIIGITLAHRRIRALERQVQIGQEQLQVSQEGQITERFTRAIEQLGSQEMAIRLGGIYALERIANDSDKDYWPIMETLTAYVRENTPWQEAPTVEAAIPAAAVTSAPAVPAKPATDIQAILTVLGRRKYRFNERDDKQLDLSNTDLRGIVLIEAHLEGAIFWDAHMEEATLSLASLEWAEFQGAHLQKAALVATNLENAELSEAHLEGARLNMVHLVGAVLDGVYLEKADLSEAHLEKAGLNNAHLDDAVLKGTHLEGADLRDATGLTNEQLAVAIIDEKTKLPDYLQEKRPKESGPGGNNEA